jgi:hypothetical protein
VRLYPDEGAQRERRTNRARTVLPRHANDHGPERAPPAGEHPGKRRHSYAATASVMERCGRRNERHA